MRHRIFTASACLGVSVLVVGGAIAQSSTSTVTYQGVLTEGGSPVADGTHALTFTIYDAATGGIVVETIPHAGDPPLQVQTTQGRFSVAVPVTPSSFNGTNRWWSVTFNGTELSRQKVTSAPYAIRATTASDVDGVLKLDWGQKRIEVNEPIGNNQEGMFGGLVGGSQVPWIRTHTRFQSGNNGDYVARFEFSDTGLGDSGVQFIKKNGGGDFHLLKCYYAGLDRFIVDQSGNVAITGGNLYVGGSTSTGVLTIRGADVAEPFNFAGSSTLPAPQPGMVVSIDPANAGKLMVTNAAYDKKVAGVMSGANGLDAGVILGKGNANPLIDGEHPVAMTGRVWVYADEPVAAPGQPSTTIEPGDRLTTSGTKAGHAMKALDESKAPGAVIGKAMTPRDEKTGMVLVLVNLQ